MSLSIQRLESLALRELSLILRKDAKNHYLSNLTVTEVRITNDLSYMTIYYTFYSGKVENYEKALQRLFAQRTCEKIESQKNARVTV